MSLARRTNSLPTAPSGSSRRRLQTSPLFPLPAARPFRVLGESWARSAEVRVTAKELPFLSRFMAQLPTRNSYPTSVVLRPAFWNPSLAAPGLQHLEPLRRRDKI